MRRDIFPLKLDSSRKQPLYVQISEAIARDVTSGRLRPGDNLPGTRQLAELLGVHRSTVVLAYNELATQSWIETRPGGPSNIAKCLPEIALTRTSRRIDGAVAVRCGYDIGPPAVSSVLSRRLPPGTLALWGAFPICGYCLWNCSHARIDALLSARVVSCLAIPRTRTDTLAFEDLSLNYCASAAVCRLIPQTCS